MIQPLQRYMLKSRFSVAEVLICDVQRYEGVIDVYFLNILYLSILCMCIVVLGTDYRMDQPTVYSR